MVSALERRPLKIDLQPDDVLLYVHIPKTGGTSLISILDARFPENEIFPLHSPSTEDYFFTFSLDELRRYRFVRGHFRFGPYDRHIYKHIAQNPICITMLRDPVQRTISEYRHIARVSHHPLHDGLVASETPLHDFLVQPQYYGYITNRQARSVIGIYPGWPWDFNRPKTLSDETLLVFAQQRLEQFAFVGLMERFEESVQLLMHTFGWSPAEEIPHLNVATDPLPDGLIPSQEMQVILSKTEIDRQIYHDAEALFDMRLEKMQVERERSKALASVRQTESGEGGA